MNIQISTVKVIDFLERYDYRFTTNAHNGVRYLTEKHGNFKVNTSDMDIALQLALLHFLRHALGKNFFEVWAALKLQGSHKKIFKENYEDVDFAIEAYQHYTDELNKYYVECEDDSDNSNDDYPF